MGLLDNILKYRTAAILSLLLIFYLPSIHLLPVDRQHFY